MKSTSSHSGAARLLPQEESLSATLQEPHLSMTVYDLLLNYNGC